VTVITRYAQNFESFGCLETERKLCVVQPKTVCRTSHDAVVRVYDEAGNVIETHEQAGDFREW
jgi:uncharacterized membrane protein